jgi:hypothetical protein
MFLGTVMLRGSFIRMWRSRCARRGFADSSMVEGTREWRLQEDC